MLATVGEESTRGEYQRAGETNVIVDREIEIYWVLKRLGIVHLPGLLMVSERKQI